MASVKGMQVVSELKLREKQRHKKVKTQNNCLEKEKGRPKSSGSNINAPMIVVYDMKSKSYYGKYLVFSAHPIHKSC